jgi:hypothetical protein
MDDMGSSSEQGEERGAWKRIWNLTVLPKCATSYGNWFGMVYRRMRIDVIGILRKMIHVRCASLEARTAIMQPWYARMLKV